MHVTLDGYIFERQSRGGISRIFHEILPLMCDLSEELLIDLWTGRGLRQNLPNHAQISAHSFSAPYQYLRPTRYFGRQQIEFRQFLLNRAIDLHDSIWHTTYYTLPKEENIFKIISVYDMIQEKFPKEFADSLSRQVIAEKRRCANYGNAFVCISETTRQDFIDFYGVNWESTYVIHLAHSRAFWVEPETDKLYDKPFLLYVGRRQGYKNFAGLLQAYTHWKRRTEIDLVVVGSSWQPEEQRLLDSYQIQNSLHLLTGVEDDYLRSLYNQAVAFVYPSRYEGFGLPLLEAMVCGCPIVASDIPVHQEIGGDVPFYFELDNIDSFIHALDQAVDSAMSALHTKKGIERAKRFSWEQTAKSMLTLYEQFV